MTVTLDLEKRLKHLYIDGSWVEAGEGLTDEIINPSTEEVFTHAPVGSDKDCELAIAAARRAFDEGPWPTMAKRDRAKLLRAFHDYFAERTEELAELIRLEAGATRVAALNHHVLGPLKFLEFCVDKAASDYDRSLPVAIGANPDGTKFLGSSVALRDPVGVVTAITAYNFPFLLALQKIGPALAMGNTIILKPSPFTPLTALYIAEAAEAVGLPPGVLNVVTGGLEVGTTLSSDPRIDLVSFTGSDSVGAKIMEQAAPTLKKVLLELGGKSALILRQDADLDIAVGAGLFSATTQAGQGCILWTRHLVHNSIKEEYLSRISAAMKAIKVGDTDDPTTVMGPLIRVSQRSRVENYVASGLSDGGTVVTGGKRPEHLAKGYFYEPTLIDGIPNSARLAQEEVFGPLVVTIGFDTDEEAIKIANDSSFGLSGHIVSNDAGTAYEMARRLRTGQVLINGGNGGSPFDPFGGIKRSGLGREAGDEGFLEFTEIKTIRYRGR